jgi:hypothetical protein
MLFARDPKAVRRVVEFVLLQGVSDMERRAFAELADHRLARHRLIMNYRLELAVASRLDNIAVDANRKERSGIQLNGGLDRCRATDIVISRFGARMIGYN